MASTSGLKRAREEELAAPAAIASSPPREESPPATRSEAARLVTAVKREFKFAGKTGKYEEFLSVLSEYKHKRLGIPGVVGRMQVILQGHPYIIRWFNRFLPNGYQLV